MITTLFAMATLATSPHPTVDADRFLHAVEQVAQAHKTPLGPYDITEPVWRDRAPKHWPYGRARVEKYARAVNSPASACRAPAATSASSSIRASSALPGMWNSTRSSPV